MLRRLALIARRRRGTILVLTLFFFGCVGMASLFGLHMIAVSTAAHSRLTETAQASAYAAASAVSVGGRGADTGGVIQIDPAGASERARAVIAENLTGQYGLRPDNVAVQVQVHNVTMPSEAARLVVNPTTCEPYADQGHTNIGTWRDHFGDCHVTSGVRVSLAITIRPCLFSGFAQKTCPPVTITGVGYADYTYRESSRAR